MTDVTPIQFSQSDILTRIDALDDAALDRLEFGVIGFDADTIVRRYNAFESRMAGLSADRVLGHGLFTTVAPCMNNFMVAQRFADAAEAAQPLDATIDYMFTLRMRPSKVVVRMLSSPAHALSYVLVDRRV